jgi:hypothetical protein
MNAKRVARIIAIASLPGFVAAAPPQVRTAPHPVIQNSNGPRLPAHHPDPQGSPPPAEQFTSLVVTVSTGADDLRSDSMSWIDLYYPDNTQQRCSLRPNQDTWDNDSTHDSPPCVFSLPKSLDQLKETKIILSYDGTGAVNSSHTQDNWNVNEVKIEAEDPLQHARKCLLDVSKSPYLVRLTGSQLTYDLTAVPNSC